MIPAHDTKQLWGHHLPRLYRLVLSAELPKGHLTLVDPVHNLTLIDEAWWAGLDDKSRVHVLRCHDSLTSASYFLPF